MNKRVGIVTHYYKSSNYGGNLQAYALCRALNKLKGVQAEQICYDFQGEIAPKSFKEKLQGKSLSEIIKIVWGKIYTRLHAEEISKIYANHARAFQDFNECVIPHGASVYDYKCVNACVEDYDAFITGSDQVWNLTAYRPTFFLDFAPSTKTKISYAASIALPSLTDAQKQIFKNSLQDYTAVSVREKSAVKLLDALSPMPVQVTLDPTLLLTREDWDEVCADRLVDGEYIFCYFLGDNPKSRKITEKYAKKRGLKIVSVPFVGGVVTATDKKFGDERLIDVSPQAFLSLVKHAKCVFTDSFHAVVFSNIYEKEYFVFNRSKKGEMSSRIVDITELFGQTEHFCAGADKESVAYVESLSAIDYTKPRTEFLDMQAHSIAFLKENLGI